MAVKVRQWGQIAIGYSRCWPWATAKLAVHFAVAGTVWTRQWPGFLLSEWESLKLAAEWNTQLTPGALRRPLYTRGKQPC